MKMNLKKSISEMTFNQKAALKLKINSTFTLVLFSFDISTGSWEQSFGTLRFTGWG